MENNSIEVNRELREFKREEKLYQLELKNEQSKIAQALKNEMGEDMKRVLNGEVQVTLPRKLKWKYRIQNFLNKLFNTF